MTMQRYEGCRCEDYPCCGHYDILHGDEQPNWCDMCGVNHSPFRDCLEDEFDDDEELDDEPTEHYVAEDAHLESIYEDAMGGDYYD